MQVPIEERGRRTNEMIPLLRRLWTAEEITHEGRYYSMEDVRIHPAPVQPGGPPIVVAGRKEPAMRRAATLGDGWFPYLYSPRRYADVGRDGPTQAADEAGRDLSAFEWCVWVFLNVNPDGDVAREEAARSMGGTYNQDFRAMVDSVAAAGTAEEVTAKLQAFYDAGARHFVFSPATAGADPRPVLDRLFAEVVPALHEHANERRALTTVSRRRPRPCRARLGLSFVPRHSGMSSPTLAAGMPSSWTTAQCAWLSSCSVKQALQRVVEAHVVQRLVHRLLDQQRRHGRELGDAPRELERALGELVGREDLAHHAEPVRLLGVDRVAGEHQLLGLAGAELPRVREVLDAAHARGGCRRRRRRSCPRPPR